MTLIGIHSLGLEADSAKVTKKIDYVGGTSAIYIGSAKPGTAVSASAWAIQKLTYDGNGNVTDVQWAGGVSDATKVWNSRASYSYS